MNDYELAILTSYEKRVVKGKKKSKGDLITESCQIKNMLKTFLTTEFIEDTDGEQIVATPLQHIVLGVVKGLKEKCTVRELKDLMEIMGEHTDKKDIAMTVSLIDKDLASRAVDND